MIEVRGVSKDFGSTRALHDVDLSIDTGELVLLLGGNGAGKSTLVRTILGLVRYRGEIRVDGFDPLRQGREVRRRIGYMAQGGGLHGDLTVDETLEFHAALRGVDPRCGEALLEAADLAGARGVRVAELSGGMVQRLCLTVAMLSGPPILLLDEPTASLDAASRSAVAGRLRRLADGGTTILVSTHAEHELGDVADRAVMLDAGRLSGEVPMRERSESSPMTDPRSGGVDEPPGRGRSSGTRVASLPAASSGDAGAPRSPQRSRADQGSRASRPSGAPRRPWTRIARKGIRDARRDRWLVSYALLLGVLGAVAALLGIRGSAGLGLQMFGRTTATLTNLCLMLAPLVGLGLGAAAIAGERDRGTLELLLAQPLERRDLLVGKYLGLVASLAFATFVGFAPAGVLIARYAGLSSIASYLLFPLLSVLLICAMTGVGLFLSVISRTGAQAQGRAVFTWFTFVLMYDLLLMGALVAAGLGGAALAALLVVNPVDAARVLAVLGLEADLHLLGPAGALLVGRLGVAGTAALLLATLAIWTALPLALAVRFFDPPSRRRFAPASGASDRHSDALRGGRSKTGRSVESNMSVEGVEAS